MLAEIPGVASGCNHVGSVWKKGVGYLWEPYTAEDDEVEAGL